MGYVFAGFFADANEAALRAALERWPFCTGQVIRHPFAGIGVRCPDPDRAGASDEAAEALAEQASSVEQGLPVFSAAFPDATFAFIRAECFGGACDYAGSVARGGAVVERREFDNAGVAALESLLKPLGVRLRSGYFEPFARGYWDPA